MIMPRSSVLFSLVAIFSFSCIGLVACNDSGGGNGGSGGDDTGGGLFGNGGAGSDEDEGGAGKSGGTSSNNECTAELDSSATTCDNCLASSCCDEYTALTNSSDMDEFAACASDCSTDSCLSSCVSEYPVAGGNFEDFITCGDSSCDSECNEDSGSDPVQNECYDSAETDACSICMASSCCDEVMSCSNSSACTNLLSCIVDCTTSTCQSDCVETYSGGADLLSGVLSCVEGSCASCS